MIGGILFVLGNVMAIIVSSAVAQTALRGREVWLRTFATLAAFPLVVMGVLAISDQLFHVGVGPVYAVLTAAALPAARALWHSRPAGPGVFPTGTPADSVLAEGPTIAWDAIRLIALGLAGGLIGAWAAATLVAGTHFVWDDLSYHAVVPAHWLRSGHLSLTALTFQSYYPLNSELFALWFMLPFHSDGMASVGVFYWGLLGATSLALLARALCGRGPAVGLTVALFLASNVVWNRSQSFSATDLAAASALLAAIVFAIPGRAERTGARKRRHACTDAATAGLMGGLAVGCKSFYLPAALLVGLALTFAPPRVGSRQRAAQLASFVAGLFVTGSAWYLRNWFVTGNPLFPADVGPWRGPFGGHAQAATQLAARVLAAPTDLAQWRDILVSRANWPLSLGLLSAFGGLVALADAWRGKARRDDLWRVRLALLLAGGSLLLLYPFLPFSATGNRPGMAPHTGYLRFLLLPFAAGLVLFSERFHTNASRQALWCAMAVLAVATAWKLAAAPSAIVFAAGAGLMISRRRVRRAAFSVAHSSHRAFAACSAVLVLLALWMPAKQRMTDRNLFSYKQRIGPIGAAWRALEELPDGSRIAFFMSEPLAYTQFHPIFGRRLQHVPVPVDANGAPRKLLHEAWDGKTQRWWSGWSERRRPIDPGLLAGNLRRASVDYVLTTRWSLGEWPIQHDALKALPIATAVFDDGYSTLWRLE